MAGWSAIWAGKARELKDGTVIMTGTKYDVTQDVLAAAALWLDTHKIEQVLEMESGRKLVLKVEIEEAGQ